MDHQATVAPKVEDQGPEESTAEAAAAAAAVEAVVAQAGLPPQHTTVVVQEGAPVVLATAATVEGPQEFQPDQQPEQQQQEIYLTTTGAEGYSMIIGDDGEQYVTVVQDGQTYAIPAAEYQAMQQGSTVTFTAQEVTPAAVQIPEPPPQPPSLPPLQHPPQDPPQQAPQQSPQSPHPPPQPLPQPPEQPQSSEQRFTQLQQQPNINNKLVERRSEEKRKYTLVNQLADSRSFKPIRVDNWGIFLLSRLQSYFQKKEFCDLTLRFPQRNAQIKVHRLVVNACTDWFSVQEAEGRLVDGVIDMASNFIPEAVAPIIRFMYTGRLDLKEGMFSKLHETATLLQMSVLTKLMDAQLNSNHDQHQQQQKKRPQRRSLADDPVRQIRHIKKIEKQFTAEDRKAKMLAARQLQEAKMAEDRIPGKKLPFWKKRSSLPSSVSLAPVTPVTTAVTQPSATQQTLSVSNGAKTSKEGPLKEKLASVKPELNESTAVKHLTGLNKTITYGKSNRVPGEKPKVPQKIREIQQTLLFEKIRRTGTKNTVVINEKGASCSSSTATKTTASTTTETTTTTSTTGASTNNDEDKDMSVDEMKEFAEEQRKRISLANDEADGDDDDDDYYDNDAEMNYSEDDEEEEDEPIPQEAVSQEATSKAPAKPILKFTPLTTPSTNLLKEEAILPDTNTPRKSVRFSLRPGNIPTPKGIDATPATGEEISILPTNEEKDDDEDEEGDDSIAVPETNEVKVPPKKRGRPPKASPEIRTPSPPNAPGLEEQQLQQEQQQQQDLVDTTVEEFSKAVEEELSGKRGIKRGRGRPAKMKDEAEISPQKKSRIDMEPPKHPSPQQHPPPKSDVSNEQAQVIAEVLKKYPNIFKENRQVKLKVMTKDPDGKSSMQYITIRAQDSNTVSTLSSGEEQSIGIGELTLGGLRTVPKVMYTGRRGRPKKIKEGEYDPHAQERKLIEKRLAKAAELAAAVQSYSGVDLDPAIPTTTAKEGATTFTTLEQVQTNPSAPTVSSQLQQQQQPLDPSSEAEALSNVASGIAASLGLVPQPQFESSIIVQPQQAQPQQAQQQQQQSQEQDGPLSDLEHFQDQPQTIMVNYCDGASQQQQQQQQQQQIQQGQFMVQVANNTQGPVQILETTADGTIVMAGGAMLVEAKPQINIEAAMAKIHDGTEKTSTITTTAASDISKKVVSQLAMDWEEEEEEEEEEEVSNKPK